MLDSSVFLLPESIAATVQYFSVVDHFDSISRGVLDSRDLVFYLSLTTAFLMLTGSSLQAARE